MNKIKKFLIFCVLAVMTLAIPLDLVSSAQQRGGKPRLKIVHLGDSYSSGNGARCENDKRNYHGVEGCYRSPTNWGSQFAQSLSDRYAVTYINRACHGGVVEDILNAREMDESRKKQGNCPSPDYPGEEYYRDTSSSKCTRYLRPQIDAVDDSVDLVLLTIGGNDLGFKLLIERCFAVGYRDPTRCKYRVDRAKIGMFSLKNDLIDMFAALRARMRPDARILYVAYPHIMLDIEYGLSKKEVYYDVREGIRGLAISGDAAQKDAVAAANAAAGEDFIFFYDGTKNLFHGHEPDPRASKKNRLRWLNEFEPKFPRMYIPEWYHFNPKGHRSLANWLPSMESIFWTEPSYDTSGHIDIAFVVETNSVMYAELSVLSRSISDVVKHIARTTESYRVSIVSYRDFSEISGEVDDYPSRVHQTFTDDLDLIQEAIDSLSTFTHFGGGEYGATVFSGIQTALELPWRPCVTQVLVVIGALPPYSPEPISDLTVSDIIANSIALGPVQVYGVDYSFLNADGEVGEIADGTGGFMMWYTSFYSTMLEMIVPQPFACFGNPYSGKIGEPVIFDLSASYDPSGSEIRFFDWDFDGDGEFDLRTAKPIVSHVYNEAFDGNVIVRVTNSWGNFTLASVRVDVNDEGYASQGDEEPCDQYDDGISIIIDDKGRFIRCTPTHLPERDQEGVEEVTGFTMTVTKVGQGTVTSSPAGINCGATCAAGFAENTVVTLTAIPSPGWTFSGWSGACTGLTCQVTMSQNRSVTATFISAPPPTTDFKIYLPLITR